MLVIRLIVLTCDRCWVLFSAVYYTQLATAGVMNTQQQQHPPAASANPPVAKIEKRMIKIPDLTTGKDLTEEVTHSKASTPPVSSASSAPDTPPEVCGLGI